VNFQSECVRDLIAVRPEEIKPSKVVLPDWQRTLKGFVLAVGPGKPNRNGKGLAPMECQVGDYVQFGAAAGMESQYDGVMIRILRDSDIDIVLKSAEECAAERAQLEKQYALAT
jgi:co-chaperonin GroES (HSP10)